MTDFNLKLYGGKGRSIDILDKWNIAPKWDFAIKEKTAVLPPFFNNVSDIEINVWNFLLVNLKRSRYYVNATRSSTSYNGPMLSQYSKVELEAILLCAKSVHSWKRTVVFSMHHER